MINKSIIAVFFIALLLRLVFLITYQDGLGLQSKIMTADAKIYIGLANNILEGKGYSADGINATAERVPLYSIFLATLFFFSQDNYFLVRIIQSILGALICVIIYLIGKNLFSNKIGIIAAVICAFYYPFIQMSAYLVTETLSIFLILLSLWWLLRLKEYNPAWYFVVGGVLLSVAGLSRSTFFGFYPLLLIILTFTFASKKVGLKISLFILLGIIITISPWVVRNYLHFHKFIPISTRSGFILYQGNNTNAKGSSGGWWPVGKEYIIPKEVFTMSEIERNSYLGKKAKKFISDHPKEFFYLFLKKIVNMWRPYYSETSNISKLVMLLSYIPVIVFGIIGILLSYKKWKQSAVLVSFIIYYMLIHAVLVSTIRYRWPVMPIFFIFAGYAIMQIKQKIQPSKYIECPK